MTCYEKEKFFFQLKKLKEQQPFKCKTILTYYAVSLKENFPMNPHVRLLVGWLVGRSVIIR